MIQLDFRISNKRPLNYSCCIDFGVGRVCLTEVGTLFRNKEQKEGIMNTYVILKIVLLRHNLHRMKYRDLCVQFYQFSQMHALV